MMRDDDAPLTVTLHPALRAGFEAWLASFGWEIGRIPGTDSWITTPGDEIIQRWREEHENETP